MKFKLNWQKFKLNSIAIPLKKKEERYETIETLKYRNIVEDNIEYLWNSCSPNLFMYVNYW